MTKLVSWKWSRSATLTVITIRAHGLEFVARRTPFTYSWSLHERLRQGGEALSSHRYTRTSIRMIKLCILRAVGEKLAKEFAGVDR